MRRELAGLIAAGALTTGCLPAAPGATTTADPASVRVKDPRIVESSGLVVLPDGFVTTNDSGDTGRLFVVDAGSGRTRRLVTWSRSPTDVEALAPAGGRRVWVADIGDNNRQRTEVAISLVPLRAGRSAVSYRLAYPDGPHDAETLLAHPRSGRLYVVTKGLAGGMLYAAPATLRSDAVNPLVEVGRVGPLVTDGVFVGNGEHVVLRGYAQATLLSWPDLQVEGSWRLPRQRQGEGIAVGPRGTLYVSSEGRHQRIRRARTPPAVRRALVGRRPSAGAAGDAAASRDARSVRRFPGRRARPHRSGAWRWVVTGGLLTGVLLTGAAAGARWRAGRRSVGR